MALSRRARKLAPLLLVALAAALLTYRRLHPSVPSIAARGGAPLHLMLAGADPYYLQRDPRWSGDPLGTTAQTLGAVGCLVSALAMGSDALGAPATPAELNRRIGAAQGYTGSALLIWEKLGPATGGAVEAVVHPRPEHAVLDQALSRGELPVVKFTLPSGAPHWVLVVGKEGEEYLIKDPLVTEKVIVKLSSRTARIESVRVLRKGPAAG
jgi:hypothetical protein